MGNKKCKCKTGNSKLCGRSLFDDEYCIFHSRDIESKKNKFKDDFWKEIERQKKEEEVFNFYGFVFPDDISFYEFEFDKNVNFSWATFSGDVDFLIARFSGGVDFIDAIFSGETDFQKANFPLGANFNKATFSGETDFHGATFSRKTYFNGVTFSREAKANFPEAKFIGKAYFHKANFCGETIFSFAEFSGGVDFIDAIFSGEAHFSYANFSGEANFHYATFSGKTYFHGATFSGKGLYGLFESLRNRVIKRIIKGRYKIKDFKFHLSEKIAKEYPMIDRMTKDAWYLNEFKNNHKFIYSLWNITAKCGQSIWRWMFWSIFFAVYFAVNFYLIYYANSSAFNFDFSIEANNFGSFLYYSVVTFTTLGFGDIIPTTNYAQRWVMAEVIMGYVMLGGLISIFANKLARRS